MQSVLAVLEEEWRQAARGPAARRRLRRWAVDYPGLAGFADLQELLDARHSGPGAAQRVLLPLARLAPHDELAALSLLQALVPGIVILAATSGCNDPGARDELVVIAWERIRTYPTTRLGSVAANVLRDTRKRYVAHRAIEAPTSISLQDGQEDAGPSAEFEAMSPVLLSELAAATRRGLVSRRGLGLVLRTRVADVPIKSIAAEQGADVHALVAMRSRAEQRLRRLPLAG